MMIQKEQEETLEILAQALSKPQKKCNEIYLKRIAERYYQMQAEYKALNGFYYKPRDF